MFYPWIQFSVTEMRRWNQIMFAFKQLISENLDLISQNPNDNKLLQLQYFPCLCSIFAGMRPVSGCDTNPFFQSLNPPLSLHPCRFRAGDRPGDLLQDRALHAPVLLLLPGHSGVPAGHHGRRHAHLEHPAPAGRLPRAARHHHQPLAGRSFPPPAGQRLRGVALLSLHRTGRGTDANRTAKRC